MLQMFLEDWAQIAFTDLRIYAHVEHARPFIFRAAIYAMRAPQMLVR